MPASSILVATVPLLAALAAPPQPACTDKAQGLWLQGCMMAVTDSDSVVVFEAEQDLAGSFVRVCEEKARQGLSKGGWPPAEDGCSTEERVEWLAACERDARALVPGTRRSTVENHFAAEGGFTPINHRLFFHERCTFLQIDVGFTLEGGSSESPNDVVQSVEMYIGYIVWD